MGLAEKRVAKTFEEQIYPELVGEINGLAGKELAFEVHWDQLALEGKSHLFEECWKKVYFDPIIEALKNICVDDMGKEAVAAGLDKIVIQNEVKNSIAAKCCQFENKILTVNHLPLTNIGEVQQRAQAIQKAIEKAL